MATDGEGDAIMADSAAEGDPEATKEAAEEPSEAPAEGQEAAAAEPAPEEKVGQAEAAKEAGNGLLKGGDLNGAVEKYSEGIALTEPILEKKDVGEELLQRCSVVYTALRLNSAQACLKLGDWMSTVDHCEKVLAIDGDNAKALYRRGSACIQIDTEGRQEQARADFARVAQLDPSNRDARQQLQRAKERLKELRQAEKQRLASALTGGLYQEHHDRHEKQQAAYQQELERRREAGEDEITYDEYVKKEKEKDEELKKQQKEELEKQKEAELKAKQQAAYDQEVARRREAGEEEVSLEDFLELERLKEEELKRARIGGTVQTTEAELDEEEKKMIGEIKSKGYYHGRLNTVPSAAAPKPQQIESSPDASPHDAPTRRSSGSEWNQAGTWEEKDVSEWAKERLTSCLSNASAASMQVALASGASPTVSAKVSKVKSLTGDAHIVTVRKKPRHGYNYEAELSFKLTFDAAEEGEEKQSFSGAFVIHELMDAVPPEDLKVDIRWKGSAPSQTLQPAADETVYRLADDVRAQVAIFREEYQQKS